MYEEVISYYFDHKFGNFVFSFGHPMKPLRINMVHELVKSYGLNRYMNIKKGSNVSNDELKNFHEDEYLNTLNFKNDFKKSVNIKNYFPINNGDDCPIFSGIAQFVQLYSKASYSGAIELSKEKTDIVVNWSGGFHHAKNNESSGFCYVNDIIISILELLKTFKKILYIDIDAHHGDGVEEAFILSKRVLCLSFHNFQKLFFPETGCQNNGGSIGGKCYSFNFPLKPGLNDQSFKNIFKPILIEILHRFQPNVVVFQTGADSLSKDPLGKFNLSIKGHGHCVDFLKKTRLPLLILGGGGYKLSNVSRCWANETSLILNKELSNKIPYNIYWQRYRGFFRLNFKVSKKLNKNSKKSLKILRDNIIINVRKIRLNT